MATVNIVFGRAEGAPGAQDQPLLYKRVAESITSSGTSQQSTNSAVAGSVGSEAVQITSDGNVWIEIGSNPTASAASSILLIAGQIHQYGIKPGQRVAVIDAAL